VEWVLGCRAAAVAVNASLGLAANLHNNKEQHKERPFNDRRSFALLT